MAETRRRGFHGLEDRIHELEEADRKAEARHEEVEKKEGERGEPDTAEIKPPPAHDE